MKQSLEGVRPMNKHYNSFGVLILAGILMLGQTTYPGESFTVDIRGSSRLTKQKVPQAPRRPATKESHLPTTFELRQNYPNPFNASTTIEYTLPIEAGVFIAIYDIFFNRVRTIKNQTSHPGHYEVHWDGRDDRGDGLASGLYFCLFAANDNYLVGKMMLVK
jgi:hypothetical protein